MWGIKVSHPCNRLMRATALYIVVVLVQHMSMQAPKSLVGFAYSGIDFFVRGAITSQGIPSSTPFPQLIPKRATGSIS